MKWLHCAAQSWVWKCLHATWDCRGRQAKETFFCFPLRRALCEHIYSFATCRGDEVLIKMRSFCVSLVRRAIQISQTTQETSSDSFHGSLTMKCVSSQHLRAAFFASPFATLYRWHIISCSNASSSQAAEVCEHMKIVNCSEFVWCYLRTSSWSPRCQPKQQQHQQWKSQVLESGIC